MADRSNPGADRAERLAGEGRIEEALACYDSVLEADPENGGFWNNKAILLVSLGRIDEAIGCAKKAAAIDPGSKDAWINLGIALYRAGQTDEAAESLERAVSIDPYNAYARAMLGTVYQQLDMGDQADAQNRKLHELVFPHGYAGYYFALAAFLLGLLLGGILSVEGAPAAVSAGALLLIVFFFIAVAYLYWRSLRIWYRVYRHGTGASCRTGGQVHGIPANMCLLMAMMVVVFAAGIVTGQHVWGILQAFFAGGAP